MSSSRGLRKLFAFFSGKSNENVQPHTKKQRCHSIEVSAHARKVASVIRNDLDSKKGLQREPAIILHGVMPRSGTVHVGNLIKLHPGIAEFPNNIWEIPFLSSTDSLLEFQNSFFATYSMNDGKIGADDFLAIFGSAFIHYLHALIPINKRLFVKEPRVNHLEYFFSQFPEELLVLLMRDGRDVVNSTIKSWPEYSFEKSCQQWQEAAQRIIGFLKTTGEQQKQVYYVKYEDILADPISFAHSICDWAKLDRKDYPFEKIAGLPVQGSSAIQQEGRVDWEPRKKPDDFNPIGRWQSWDRRKIDTFKRIAGETLVLLDYETDLNW